MGNFLNPENKFMVALNRIVDAVILGVLWFVCCIPVITVGASSTAFYYAYHKAIRQKRGYAWKEFFGGFKSNFKQSTIIWLILAALYIITGVDCLILSSMKETPDYMKILLASIIAIIVLITVWAIYLFPYLARFENTTKVILKNSALIAMANAPWSFVLLILFVVVAVALVLIPQAMFFVPALYMWVANKILERVFRKYMSEEDVKAQEELDKQD